MTLYRVTGSRAFLGHQPGESFTADLDPDMERRAKARGAIRVVKRDDDNNTTAAPVADQQEAMSDAEEDRA